MSGTSESRLPVAVLVSGNGSNLQALLDAASKPDFAAEVAVVISDRPGVLALQRAERSGVPTAVVPWPGDRDRDAFTSSICRAVRDHGAEALVLAGFMRILGREAIERFPNRIVNIHPALLPAFPGAQPVPDAIAHGAKVTGVTVHFVDEKVDHGPIIYQEPVTVRDDDTVDTLHARLHEVEHRVYPAVVDAMARGALTVEGRRVTWEGM